MYKRQVFYCLIVKEKNAKSSCYLLLFFAVALKGLVCKLAAEHQIRYTKRVDLPTDVAVQVVSLVLGGVVSVVTQRKVWTPLSKNLPKYHFKTRPVGLEAPIVGC